MMQKKTLPLILVLLGMLYVSMPAFVHAQNEPAPQPSSDNAQVVDITTDCAGVPEDPKPDDPGNKFPPEFKIITIPGSFPGTPVGSIDWKIDSLGELLHTMGFVGDQGSIPPTVSIRAGHFGGNEGDQLTLTSNANGFYSASAQQLVSWWDVRNPGGKEVLYSLNGVVAGGKEFRTPPLSGPTACGIVTRDPAKEDDSDTNGDGMGDRWEMQYFGKLSVDPQGDQDRDGVIVQPFLSHDEKKALSIAPSSRSKNGKSFATGDGTFGNLEEYIWGTNPLDPDSDDDGYLDEEDVSGVGQQMLNYVPSEFSGAQKTIQVEVAGTVATTGKDESLVNQIVGYRAPYIIDRRQMLAVQVSSSDDSPNTDTPFRVQADIYGTKYLPNFLKFTWKVGTKDGRTFVLNIPGSPCSYVSFGNILDCNFRAGTITPGEVLQFDVTAEDVITGEVAKQRFLLPIGGSVLLTSDPLVVPQFPFDATTHSVNNMVGNSTVGERWVAVTANLPGEDPTQYRFRWYVDNVIQNGSCASAPLPKDALGKPQGLGGCGVGANILYFHATGLNTAVYNIAVAVEKATNSQEFGTGILPVYTDPTPASGSANKAVTTSLLTVPQETVRSGSVVTVNSRYVETSDESNYEYEWLVDGVPVPSARNSKVLNFTAQPRKTDYTVALTVTQKENGVPKSRQVDQAVVHVENTPAFDEWKNAKLAALAPLYEPLIHTGAGNSSLLLLAVGIILIAGTLFFGKKLHS